MHAGRCLCATRPLQTFLFFFNHTATTEIYTLSLHDALPICPPHLLLYNPNVYTNARRPGLLAPWRSEEHTSELQSREDLVCRLLLEQKKTIVSNHYLSFRHETETSLTQRYGCT